MITVTDFGTAHKQDSFRSEFHELLLRLGGGACAFVTNGACKPTHKNLSCVQPVEASGLAS